ncbi:hypothetical protein M8C21_013641 [Ambrosia artemisiifolia]|uniref:Uncharacterized protein n=1 Tax=Ambrosia artemisiifolia TaxID=4212 RepID=A0AAD5BWV8_AMBAR|nr:hypothetical protein M8C21_013641 [Ambrosia artemisiifolia]
MRMMWGFRPEGDDAKTDALKSVIPVGESQDLLIRFNEFILFLAALAFDVEYEGSLEELTCSVAYLDAILGITVKMPIVEVKDISGSFRWATFLALQTSKS